MPELRERARWRWLPVAIVLGCGGPKLGPPPTSAERLNAEGVRRLDRGDDAGAEQMIRDALRESELVDDLVAEAESWNNLGALAMARGNPREAWADHRTALELHQATKTRGPGEVRTRANLGAALLALGKNDEARAQFEEAVALAGRIGAPPLSRLARVGLAAVALHAGDARRADALAQEVIATPADPAASDAALGGAFFLQGAAREVLGDWAEARASFEHALTIDRGRGVPRAVVEDLRALARVAERAGSTGDAALYLTRSARVARRLGDLEGAARDLAQAIALTQPSSPDGAAALEAELRALQPSRP